MSLRAPSLLGLLAVLQQHGLTYAQLATVVAAVTARHTGPVLIHMTEGRLRSVEVRERPERTPLRHD